MDTSALIEQRAAKDRFFAEDHHSPLGPEEQAIFDGLRYFSPNPELVFDLAIEPADGAEIEVATSDGHVRSYRRVGRVGFTVNGTETGLTLYSTGHPGLFIPFRDATSGVSTYGAGRYLDVEPTPDGRVVIDFNQAYNPFCVYDEAYSCPLPPVENWLEVPIEAGEMDYPGPAER